MSATVLTALRDFWEDVINMKKFIVFLMMSAIVVAFTACGRHITPQKNVNQNVTYLCPMHKEYISSQPGKCPKCGMDLVSFDDYQNSKSGNPKQSMAPDTHSGMGGSGGGQAGHH